MFNNLTPRTITSFTRFAKMFISNYASNKPMRKESHHLFLIIQGRDETIKEYMRRFREEKIEIVDCPSSIAIEAFRKGLLRRTNIFAKLTKMVLHLPIFEEVQIFVNLECELRLRRKKKLL